MTAKRGVTLIEMLAAVALSALLLMVLLSVATSVKRAELAIEANESAADRHVSLLRLVRQDVAAARAIADDGPRGFALDGYGALDPRTLEPTHEPAVVTYRVVRLGDEVALVRDQVAAIGGNAMTFSEVVATGVEGVALRVERPAPAPPGVPAEPPRVRPEERRFATFTVMVSERVEPLVATIELR